MDNFNNAHDLVSTRPPATAVLCNRPDAATRAGRWFVDNFPGKSFYAVKANPAPWLIEALVAGGIRHFDVASIEEVRQIRAQVPEATLAFMHPIKSRAAIREAYFEHGVRTFSLDSLKELRKIVEETDSAEDLTLCVRLAVRGADTKIPLGKKFGIAPLAAAELLQETRHVAWALGIAFHVGSQCMEPGAYRNALDDVQRAIVHAGVIVDVIDVGGGFPSAYPDMSPPPLDFFVREIATTFERMLITEDCELWCEPGRALCAEASSLIVQVLDRRGETLHINDGAYGSLADAGVLNWQYPVQLLTGDRASHHDEGYSFFGPTCDDADFMAGPFYLPAGVEDGDYIEIGMLGAYGECLATQFNGFGKYERATLTDEPMFSMYRSDAVDTVIRGVQFGEV